MQELQCLDLGRLFALLSLCRQLLLVFVAAHQNFDVMPGGVIP